MVEPSTTGGFMSTTQARINLSNSSDSTTRNNNSERKETLFEPQIKPAEILTESMALLNTSDVIIPETVAPEVLKAATEAILSSTTVSTVAAVTNATILATTQEKRIDKKKF